MPFPYIPLATLLFLRGVEGLACGTTLLGRLDMPGGDDYYPLRRQRNAGYTSKNNSRLKLDRDGPVRVPKGADQLARGQMINRDTPHN